MGKKATPKVAIEAKNHMENHVTFSLFGVLSMVISILTVNSCSNGFLIEQAAKVYKPFHSAS